VSSGSYSCNCAWRTTSQSCGCVAIDGVPACQAFYPAPNTSYFHQLAVPNQGFFASDRLSLFGDSITWYGLMLWRSNHDQVSSSPPVVLVSRLGGYATLLKQQLAIAGLPGIPFFNRGIDGGFVKDLRDGIPSDNILSFDEYLKSDRPTIVTIFIGTNDVWFPTSPRHSDPDQFVVRCLCKHVFWWIVSATLCHAIVAQSILTGLVRSAQQYGASVMLSTLRCHWCWCDFRFIPKRVCL
jgi:lysophospholipase L1-like esterase